MNVLIAYGTTEGQTRKIARYMAGSMREAGHDVTLHDCTDLSATTVVTDYEAVVLAASVHHKRYQTAFYGFVKTNLSALQTKPLAFVSVSLSQTLASGEDEARSYVNTFTDETGLKPDAVHLAEGAVRYFEYGRAEEETIDLLVFKGQKKMPDRGSNPEYTDWDALDAFASTFLEGAGQKP